MKRDYNYRKHYRDKHIRRKQRILHSWGVTHVRDGYLDKGKVKPCSCDSCVRKTKKDGYPHREQKFLQESIRDIIDNMENI